MLSRHRCVVESVQWQLASIPSVFLSAWCSFTSLSILVSPPNPRSLSTNDGSSCFRSWIISNVEEVPTRSPRTDLPACRPPRMSGTVGAASQTHYRLSSRHLLGSSCASDVATEAKAKQSIFDRCCRLSHPVTYPLLFPWTSLNQPISDVTRCDGANQFRRRFARFFFTLLACTVRGTQHA